MATPQPRDTGHDGTCCDPIGQANAQTTYGLQLAVFPALTALAWLPAAPAKAQFVWAYSGQNVDGNGNVAIGAVSGTFVTGFSNTATGTSSGSSLTGDNNAVQTGNFTVLRDTGAPGFREAHSTAQLSRFFSNLGAQKVDLSAVAVITPQLSEPPVLDQQKAMLRLKGYFPGEPVRIDFDLIYQAIEGRSRLFGLSVQPNRSAASAPQTPDNGESTTYSKKHAP
ncbi:MAG: hypothetical protein A49_10770 [Methyloceanibacter sp.]|nr:MAG: hypothetical protein A49_10770 [Methyloceanibacter sp.]